MTELKVRETTIEDARILTDIYNHYVLNTHITFDMEPVSADSRLEWLSHYNQDPMHRLSVSTVNDEDIGYASSSQFRPK